MITDPIADMLTRIKNAYMARKETVIMPYSKVKESIAKVLIEHKYIKDAEMQAEDDGKKNLKVTLSYVGKTPAMTDVKRVSKPGLRKYSGVDTIKRTLGGYGITIVSTSQGVMDDKSAKKKNIGGEVLCQVW
ncbi:30S ribosomal protein S8 [Candidatus Woesebacteria bacterium]|nr:30S ribosomal protein S8 [Candidatus Woesebacteria bacterium]